MKARYNIIKYLYLCPAIAFILMFLLYPCISIITLSFKEGYSRVTQEFNAIGIGNYAGLFSDEYFIKAIKNTFGYVIVTVPITMVLSMIYAMVLSRRIKLRSFFSAVLLFPLITSSTAIGYAWRYIFNTRYGVANYILQLFNIPPIPWLNSTGYSFVVLCVLGIWKMIPFTTIILVSVLRSLDDRYKIIAAIDGASSFLVFRKITLPGILPMFSTMVLLNTITSLQVFDELFPLYLGKPGPFYNLYTVVYYVYEQIKSSNRNGLGSAAAASILITACVLILMLVISAIRAWVKNSLSSVD